VSGTRAIQLVEAGLWLRMSGDLEGARRLFEQALRLDPGCERARELLGTKPEAAEELPEELQHVPSSTTNLFAVPLPRLFPEAPVPPEAPDAPTDPFIPMSLLPPLPPSYAVTTPLPEPRPMPPMTAATPLPPPQRTPLPSAPSERGTPLPGRKTVSQKTRPPTQPPAAQRTPVPAAPPERRTPLPVVSPPERGTPRPQGPPTASAAPEGFVLGAASTSQGGGPSPSSPAVPLPEPAHTGAAAGDPLSGASDDWWTDGVTTPPPPKDAWEVGRPRPTTLSPSEASEGDAIHMVAPLPASAGGTPLPAQMPSDPRREAYLLLQRATELQELDDHSGARELLLQAQALDPEAPQVARALAESEQTLQALYESKLGKLSIVPRVRLRDDEVIWLNLDHRAGFILAQIDGALSFDDLFSVSGMSRLDTARILVQLLEQRVIVR
jgi:hypothetical protein